MKFVWVPSINRFRRTEGEVKKAKQHYEVLDIEIDKDSLIDRFNAYEEKIETLARIISQGGHTAAETPAVVSAPELEEVASSSPPPPAPVQPPLPPLQAGDPTADQIEQAIIDAPAGNLTRFMLAGIEALGTLGVKPVGKILEAFLDRDYAKPGRLDRGLLTLSIIQAQRLTGMQLVRQAPAPVKVASNGNDGRGAESGEAAAAAPGDAVDCRAS